MGFDLSKTRHALVTGAAGAIGGALARELSARSPEAILSLVDNDARGVEALARELGPRSRPLVWDLAHPDELAAAYDTAAGDAPVDVLVNCAGIMELRSFVATPWSLGSRLLAIDLLSPIRLMSLATPAMRSRGSGVVVNLASMAAMLPIRGSSFYGAAKAGLAMASEIARIELAAAGVQVLTVYPGPVASGLERHARAQVKRSWIARALPTGEAAPLAERIVRAIEQSASRVVYPPVYVVAARAMGLARVFTEHLSPATLE
jgi:short-subunit dehydrogenase